eukprot:TRINITY_DN2807_c0_g1_i1.p1 TRINITY_DN2807_c0_g1~~TRINITY_DN2807_c0_g1_i1.p1  ORF type:complete len:529 (-),score=56.65 TRINITY_DN2807_c0_g1_i1:38-1624(-)
MGDSSSSLESEPHSEGLSYEDDVIVPPVLPGAAILLPPHHHAVAPQLSITNAQRRLPHWRMMGMEAFWFSSLFTFCAVYLTLLPAKVFDVVGSQSKSSVIGILFSCGAACNFFLQPLIGTISDRFPIPYLGQRRPYIRLGGLVAAGGAICLPHANTLYALILSFVCLSIGINATIPVISALLPDVVPKEQRGIVSGYSVLFYALGAATGTISTGFILKPAGFEVCSYLVAGVIGVGLVFVVLFVPERKLRAKMRHVYDEQQRRSWGRRACKATAEFLLDFVRPFKNSDFVWFSLVQFFFYSAMLVVQQFSFYYLTDVIDKPFSIFGIVHVSQVSEANSIWTGTSLAGQIFCSLIAGILADSGYVGRRTLSSFGSLCVIAGTATVLSSTLFVVSLAGAILFGIGMGVATTANMSISSHVTSLDTATKPAQSHRSHNIQDAETAPLNNSYNSDENTDLYEQDTGGSNAKDMGLLSNTTNVAQIFTSLTTGYIVQAFHGDHVRYGYVTVYCMAMCYALLAAIIVWRIKGVH